MENKNIYTDILALEYHLQIPVLDYLDEHNVDESAFRLLVYIGRHGGCRCGELTQAARMDRAMVNRKLAILGTRGWIRKKLCKSDSRAHTLHVTPAGRAILSAVEEIILRQNDEMRILLGTTEYDALSYAVKKLSTYTAGRNGTPTQRESLLFAPIDPVSS